MLIHAKCAWLRGRELARDVTLELRDGRIQDIICGAQAGGAVISTDLLLPGFVNAHCHLEYAALAGKLPRGNVPFGEWLDAIVLAKTSLTAVETQRGIEAGVKQLVAGGCTTVIDSSSLDDTTYLEHAPLRHFILFEVLGLTEQRAAEQWQRVETALSSTSNSEKLLGVGINPHAPYSVSPALRQRIKSLLAARPDIACAWHLGESDDEAQFLESQSGSIAGFLQRRELKYEDRLVPQSKERCAATELLASDGLLDRCDIAFHLNCARGRDFGFFHPPRAVVHCPSTHAFFERPAFPLIRFLSAGANACLGTDSLASADTLSMLKILRLAAKTFEWLTGPQLLDLVTRNPARTRLLAHADPPLGILDTGYTADLISLSADVSASRNLREIICDDSTEIRSVLIGGQVVHT